ncbi:MAG: hypothetical protein B7O98_07055 [Zestosphaera tikiterensis]|uniref:ArsR family transcriptional regulator n=1 Tax=Zestosphaera tikiterensis TaxID=1973259 RepID=A0A2R7Y4C3_9CREN|nr:MAG: hypothetical protein B7O98_07055 [Zestosphaera tikiterensis]
MPSDSLKRVEKLLEEILKKLERLEELLLLQNDPTTATALELALSFYLPVHKAVKTAREVVELLKDLASQDPISRAIVEVLAASDTELSISELTRRVRKLRGTASRRVIAERLRRLEGRGVVELKKVGNVVWVRLKRGS